MKRGFIPCKRIAALLLAAVLVLSTVALAWDPPMSVDTVELLLDWYGSGGNCLLSAPLEITTNVILDKPLGGDIGTQAHSIRVMDGGHLVIDSVKTNLIMMGPQIIVESGGKLSLRNGGVWGAPGETVIILREGATLERTDEFPVEGLILEESLPEPTPEPEPDPEPAPDPVPKPEPDPPTGEEPTEIYNMTDLQEWYARPSVDGEAATCELYANLFITDAVTLGPRTGRTLINTDCFRITIGSGGSLSVDNPDLEIAGYFRMLQVQSGGRLALTQGTVTADGSTDGANTEVLFVSPGGVLSRADDFQIIGTVTDQSGEPPVPLDIADLWCEKDPTNAGISLPVGCDLAQELPKRANAQVKLPDDTQQVFLPMLKWNLSGADPSTAGRCVVTGTVPETELARLNLKNPRNLSVSLEIEFYHDGPISTLAGRIFPPTSGGEMTVELRLPWLPDDTAALYIERGLPNGGWTRLTHASQDTDIPSENFLSTLGWNAPHHYIAFRLPVDYGVTRLRVSVEGSGLAGDSNVIELSPPNVTSPPPTGGDDDWDDGSSEGNRGGGGQGESDRVKPATPEPVSTLETQPEYTRSAPPVTDALAPAEPEAALVSDTDANGDDRSEETEKPSQTPHPTPSTEPSAVSESEHETDSSALPSASPDVLHKSGKTAPEGKPPVSHGTVVVAAVTILTGGGLGLATHFILKRKP